MKYRLLRRLWLSIQIARSVSMEVEECEVDLEIIGREPPRDHGPGVILTCCDIAYYEKYGRTLIETARRNSPHQHFHVHVYEPTEDWKAQARKISKNSEGLSLSWENAGRNPFNDPRRNNIYFAAARFAVARRIVEQSNSAVLVLDADGLIIRDLDEPFASFQDYDIGLIFRRTIKPWMKVAAGAVLIQPTQNGVEFVRRVSNGLHAILSRKPEFHVDQMALYYTYRASAKRLRVASLTKVFADWDFHPASYIWSAKGERKLDFSDLVQRVAESRTTEHPGGGIASVTEAGSRTAAHPRRIGGASRLRGPSP